MYGMTLIVHKKGQVEWLRTLVLVWVVVEKSKVGLEG
jgi:hypothetical protein